ncbi:MAG: hypothetical protein U0V64_08345 [Cyclobacteriaceae bacterium]
MIHILRDQFNEAFSSSRYEEFLEDIHQSFGYTVPFRIAETPVFVDTVVRNKLFQAGEEVIDFIARPDFFSFSRQAIPADWDMPRQSPHTLFLALDFAITKTREGSLEPRLIELQGFPSLYGWQHLLASKYRDHFHIPSGFHNHVNLTDSEYVDLLRKTLLGGHDPQEVVLLEIDPYKQNTAIDFIVTQHLTGVTPVHIGDVVKKERHLFYRRQGILTPIRRIFNRVIVDELARRNDLSLPFSWTEELDVEWAGHPNWFFGISKYLMPHLHNSFVPPCKLLSSYNEWPEDLENYVLKPLFSFSGTGVVFNVRREDIDAIPAEKRNAYMLQQKVAYEPALRSPEGGVKIEVRLMYIWPEGAARPVLVSNLARLSRGEMIGVRYNKDKRWVGASVCFFAGT